MKNVCLYLWSFLLSAVRSRLVEELLQGYSDIHIRLNDTVFFYEIYVALIKESVILTYISNLPSEAIVFSIRWSIQKVV